MRYLGLLALTMTVLGCSSPRGVASTPTCTAPLAAVAFTVDSIAAICLLPEFARLGDGQDAWVRGRVSDPGYAWIDLSVLDSAEAAHEWGVPPVPRSFREPDPPDVIHAFSADSVTVHAEHIDGRRVELETGLVSGGAHGASRQPALRAAWPIDGGRWVLVQGQASALGTVDSMRAMVRTVRVAQAGRGL